MSIKNLQEKVLEPEIAITTAYLIFLFSAYLSYAFPSTGKYLLISFGKSPSSTAYILSFLGIAIFIISVRVGKRFELRSKIPILLAVMITTSTVVFLTLPIPLVLAVFMGGGYAVLLYYLSGLTDISKLTGLVFLLAILSALSILIQGIPILSAATREETAVSTSRALFHGFGVFSGALIVGFYERNKALLAIIALTIAGILSGFKSDAIAIILSASITGFLLKKISLKAAGLAILAIGFILTGISTYIALVAHGTWNIPTYLYPIYRFGFTFSVYSKIIDLSIPFGFLHGQAILNTTQEIVSTTVLGYTDPHIITSTLFGPLTLDFGVIGIIITAVLLGIYMGLMKKNTTLRTALYAMALTHILVLIEVGLQLSSIMFFLSMMYLSVSERTYD